MGCLIRMASSSHRSGPGATTSRARRQVVTGSLRLQHPAALEHRAPHQAILNKEDHVKDTAFLTTLAAMCTGSSAVRRYSASAMPRACSRLTRRRASTMRRCSRSSRAGRSQSLPLKLQDILPQPLRAGKSGGQLTKEGAWLLDPTGKLQPGALMAPPEGDAGTGMVSTNAVRKRTGNISVGTSAFSMNVLDAPLKEVHRDIDVVTTPDGAPVAMVHANNCSSDLNAWIGMFGEFAELIGHGRRQPSSTGRCLKCRSAQTAMRAACSTTAACRARTSRRSRRAARSSCARRTATWTSRTSLAQLYGCRPAQDRHGHPRRGGRPDGRHDHRARRPSRRRSSASRSSRTASACQLPS